jgi:subtilase family serine protease
MLNGHRTGILAAAIVFVATGCTSASPGASPASAAPTSVVGSSALPTVAALPSAPASSVPSGSVPSSSAMPTVAPSPSAPASATPTPSHRPTPSAAATPSAPNLVVSKFTSDVQELALNVPASFNVTVRNVGSTDAAAFQVVVTYSPKGSNDQTALDAQSVNGLAAGDSVQLTFTGSISEGGDYVFIAAADSADEIIESDEDDNTRALALSSVSLPNLAFDSEGIILSTCIGGPDANVQFDFGVNNVGTADVTKPFSVGITWYKGGTSSGTLDPEQITAQIPAGIGYLPEFCRMLPGSGSYEVHFFIDSDRVIAESHEDDNEITVDVVIP